VREHRESLAICPQCGGRSVALIRSTQLVGRRIVAYDECASCHSAAESRAQQLKLEAEEDRKVKMPAEEPRKRRPTQGPFALQLEGDDP
jgi:hypothetical protein